MTTKLSWAARLKEPDISKYYDDARDWPRCAVGEALGTVDILDGLHRDHKELTLYGVCFMIAVGENDINTARNLHRKINRYIEQHIKP